MASSTHSPSGSPITIDAEWTPVEESPQLPPSPRVSVVKLRVKRRRASARAPADAPATARGARCRVCGSPALPGKVRVGPWKVHLCTRHAGFAFGAATALKLLIG